MCFSIDDAHPSSLQHVVNGVCAGPVQVALILPELHKPETISNELFRMSVFNISKGFVNN